MQMNTITGSEALICSLLAEEVDTIFGYPGGQIMPVFDKLYDYRDRLKHILVRHEQGAVHAAQGYARACGKPGVVIVTSGPGATNAITGIADAMIDSTPLVVITGQVPSGLLGTDAFQETDVLGITLPITKWSYQIRSAGEIPEAVARAFYIARSGRPGPVVLDLPKTTQLGTLDFNYSKCDYIRSYDPVPVAEPESIDQAAELIRQARKPFLIFGQGVLLSHAEQALKDFIEKSGIPAASTLLGLSALPSDHPLYKGMVGMHGNLGPNKKTNECDLLIAVGMRFDDRVTSDVGSYAKQAKVIHIDIDPSEIGKNVSVEIGILGDAKVVLEKLTDLVDEADHTKWCSEFDVCNAIEQERVIAPETRPQSEQMTMGEVVARISHATGDNAIVVTDVGQNQMMGARYSRYNQTRSLITSGGLGTMGFGLPAAIGAKIASPERTVCFFTGDGGLQMTIQELGTILQENTGVKIIVLNNSRLGMVRQWQELFFDERYSETTMVNPDFVMLAAAYGIKGSRVSLREHLDQSIAEMLADDKPYLLEVIVEEKGMVFPMIPGGKCVSKMMLNTNEWY
ncbi:MAG: biosynthetic-type acetolactate synthase large subunit [Bacteroidales bacterium]